MRSLKIFFFFIIAFQIQINASNLSKLAEPTFSIPAPTGASPQAHCQQSDGSFPFTLADLVVFNTQGYSEIFWFADTDQNIALPATTSLEDGVIYYAFQAVDPSAAYLEVEVQMIPYIPAPLGDAEQYFCYEQTWTLNDVVVENTVGYTDIYWLDNTPCQGGQPVDPNTIINDGDIYFAVQGVNGCCPGTLEVTIFIPDPYPAPNGDSDQYFTEGTYFTLSDAEVYNTGSFDGVYWFSTPTQEAGSEVDPDTIVNDGDMYYAFQGIGCGNCQCFLHLEVTFHMIPIGVTENKESFFNIYPSPANDVLTISFDTMINNLTLRITDANGKLVYTENIHSLEADLKIDVSN
ncbi:MAG TPA: T9SS type A sorting domain-containing protein [Lutibacter sp.]|nr:T9SS type A sorting domain-containing protein [Lutibacter sp.]